MEGAERVEERSKDRMGLELEISSAVTNWTFSVHKIELYSFSGFGNNRILTTGISKTTHAAIPST